MGKGVAGPSRWMGMLRGVRALGVKGAAIWGLRQRSLRGSGIVSLISRDARYPLLCRAGTSDRDVFRQVFVEQHYSCLETIHDPGWVIDCGANVGYSAAYFLSRFPNCQLIAVEPDPANVALLRRNLEPYGRRARIIHGAVWSHSGPLKMSEVGYRDGLSWTRQVRECRADEAPELHAFDMDALVSETGAERISIVKMDIEGAEARVFAGNCSRWLARADALLVELHDDTLFGRASEAFMAAVTRAGFCMERHGEITVCMRSRSCGLAGLTG